MNWRRWPVCKSESLKTVSLLPATERFHNVTALVRNAVFKLIVSRLFVPVFSCASAVFKVNCLFIGVCLSPQENTYP